MNISLRTTFYAMGCLAGLLILLYFGQPVLVSLCIALLTSFILYPVCTKLEKWGFGRVAAAFTAMLGTFIFVAGILALFSAQIVSLTSEFTDFEQKLFRLSDEIIVYLNQKITFIPNLHREQIINKSQEWFSKSGGAIVSDTFNQTAAIISGLIMVTVYTFLFLIYRSGLKKVVVQATKQDQRTKVSKMINEMQKVGQQYLIGMVIMILILGTANSVALIFLGIEHPFFFGFLAGVLSIIPYVGTTLGATIPTLYAFMTEDSLLVPLGVVITFWSIQLIESNFLSPKIVGGNLNINALAAIFSLIIGGYLWGVAGMALFLPLTAIFKVFCSKFEQLQPISLLLGGELYESEQNQNISKFKENLKKAIKKKSS